MLTETVAVRKWTLFEALVYKVRKFEVSFFFEETILRMTQRLKNYGSVKLGSLLNLYFKK